MELTRVRGHLTPFMVVVSLLPRRVPWASVLAATTLLAFTAVLLLNCLRLTAGRLVYTLDDPYIHMALARALALHGTWGITPGRFEPASSSPVWTLLQAGLGRLLGVSDVTPLVAGLVAAVSIVFFLDRALGPYIRGTVARAAMVTGIALMIPVPPLVFSGMEVLLHVLLVLALSWRTAKWLAGDPSPSRWTAAGVLALSTLAVLTRFESTFLVAGFALVALVRRRPAVAAALVVGAALAVGGYATFSLARGGMWLPNSILLKAQVTNLDWPAAWRDFALRIPRVLAEPRSMHVVALLLAAGWLLLARPGTVPTRAAVPRLLLLAFVPAMLLHVQLAALGWFFRYEAYLVAVGISAIAAAMASEPARILGGRSRGRWGAARVALAALVWLALVAPVLIRAAAAVRRTPLAARSVYEEQFQMGHFVHDYLHGRSVAVNDVGAVAYYGDARTLDLYGLASNAVTRAKLAHRFDTVFIERLCADEGVSVALVYESWFTGMSALPRTWRPVARWTIQNKFAPETTVTIFATDSDSAGMVRAAAREFSGRMPKRVGVEIID